MLSKFINHLKLKYPGITSLDDGKEFLIGINQLNLVRVKITIIIFLLLETMMLTLSIIYHWGRLFRKPTVFYLGLYSLMIFMMIGFGIFFMNMKKDVAKNLRLIRIGGIYFISIILLWCATITLLDQFSNSQVMIYVVAIISISVVPIFKPLSLFIVYSISQGFFLVLLPYFQENQRILFANSVNTTTFLILAWAIAFMRYQQHVEDFRKQKLINAKNEELKRINQELLTANQMLEILSYTDGLTGIYNYMMFKQQIEKAWEKGKAHVTPLSLIMIDIDHFKDINDNFGHQTGDEIIKQIASVLRTGVRESQDIVARYGGDEFVIILPNTHAFEALEIAKKLRKDVEEKVDCKALFSGKFKKVTISLGVNATIPSEKSKIQEFLKKADQALYKAKVNRNCQTVAG